MELKLVAFEVMKLLIQRVSQEADFLQGVNDLSVKELRFREINYDTYYRSSTL